MFVHIFALYVGVGVAKKKSPTKFIFQEKHMDPKDPSVLKKTAESKFGTGSKIQYGHKIKKCYRDSSEMLVTKSISKLLGAQGEQQVAKDTVASCHEHERLRRNAKKSFKMSSEASGPGTPKSQAVPLSQTSAR